MKTSALRCASFPARAYGHLKGGDQYALGCIAYELVTGCRPFTAPDFLSMGFKHLTEQPIPPTQHNPHVPAATEAAILRALAKLRTERYADIPTFLVTLQAPFAQATVLNKLPSLSSTTPAVLAPPTRTKEEWLDTGYTHYKAGCYTEALDAYEQAIRLDPESRSSGLCDALHWRHISRARPPLWPQIATGSHERQRASRRKMRDWQTRSEAGSIAHR